MGNGIYKIRNIKFQTPPVRNKTIMQKTVLTIILAVMFADVYCADVRVGKTQLKVSPRCSVVFKNSLSVDADALVQNNGDVYFSNEQECTLSLNTILGGEGVYNISGEDNCIITGEGAAVSSLNVESGNLVYVDHDFTISGELTLRSGIISVIEGGQIKITGTSPDAVVFNDSYDNSSFIEGTIVRNTTSGNEYSFPIGTATEGFHPIKIRDLSSSGYLTVIYRPAYDDDWNTGSTKVTLGPVGAWQVNTEAEGITFVPSLSLYSSSGILEDSYNIFYTPEVESASPDFSLDYNSGTGSNGYLSSSTSYRSGLFAVSAINTGHNVEGEEIPEMVNFLAKNGTGRTTFEIPGIENYKEVILSIYNRFGNKIYESSDYANDFDSKDYRPGTYYYKLILVTKEDRKILDWNIIEIVEYK